MLFQEAISDIGIGLIGGYVGTKVMEPVGMKATHLRGFANHLVFGLGVAATAEVLAWLGHNARRSR